MDYKSSWLDNRIQLNTALFFTTYNNFQAQNFVVNEKGAIGTQLLNMGELESKGIELESIGLIGDNLKLNFV